MGQEEEEENFERETLLSAKYSFTLITCDPRKIVFLSSFSGIYQDTLFVCYTKYKILGWLQNNFFFSIWFIWNLTVKYARYELLHIYNTSKWIWHHTKRNQMVSWKKDNNDMLWNLESTIALCEIRYAYYNQFLLELLKKLSFHWILYDTFSKLISIL